MEQNKTSKPCMFLITYSFDSDYVAHICENREQAEKIREYYLQEEIKTLEEEQEYTPAVDKTDPDCWIMFYDHEGSTDEDPDTADYRIIDGTHHCAVAEQELKKLQLYNQTGSEIRETCFRPVFFWRVSDFFAGKY